jgi:2-polyprenyl-3-methyl-5-hydroxy-6-metoxy-1,4-benzoquinol methylase
MKNTLKTYQKLCTEFYDLELSNHKNTSKALAFFMDYAKKANGPILEPMCGTGRFLIPMLQEGLDIQGFDASSHMLDALKQKYAKISSQQPPVWQQFIQDFKSEKKYNLIFIPFGSWGLITDIKASKECLSSMYKHLSPTGKLVLEIETVESVPKPCDVWRYGSHTRDDGSKLAIKTLASYNPQTQIYSAICKYESIRNNQIEATETENFEQYLYKFNEMDQLLKEVGFTTIKKHPDYFHTSVVNPKSQIIIYEAIK